MTFDFRPLDADAAREIIGWRYPPPYDVYDVVIPPDRADVLEAEIAFFMDPANAYFGMYAPDGTTPDARTPDWRTLDGRLEAFCCFGREAQVPGGDYSADALDLGLGVRPDLTGQGRGKLYVGALIEHGLREYRPALFRTTIAAFNTRALRVWEHHHGFRRVGEFPSEADGRPFVLLVRDADPGRVAPASGPH